MTQIVSFEIDDYAVFEVQGPPVWSESQRHPIDPDAERSLHELSSGRFGDFMKIGGPRNPGNAAVLASERAWQSRLAGRFGAFELAVGRVPEGYRVVLIAARLDVIDFDRSVIGPSGRVSGLHTVPVADELAADCLYSPVGIYPNRLLCSDSWAAAYRAEAFEGLRFEPARVG